MVEPRTAPRAEDSAGDDAEAASDPWNAEPERRAAEVTEALHGKRLDKAVVAMAPEFSRNHLQGLIEQGHVSLDGAAATTPSRRVVAGQRIEIALMPTAESRAFRPEPLPLDIVHEDAHVLVIDKPAGMVVHPAAGNWTGTVMNAVLAHASASARLPRAGIVHRLDKDTSGLMVIGKTLPAVTALSREIAARRVHRRYLAIVQGEVREDAFSIAAPIGRDPQSRVRMAVVASGKEARTDVVCLARRDGHSALLCTLHTGRTHQIRVHLASRGHPLVSDATYGGKPAFGMTRQALHASRLAFVHPAIGADVEYDAPMPPDFAAAWSLVVAGGAR